MLKFLVAFELISRAFSRFPGAKATAYRVMGLVVGLTLVTVIWLAAGWQARRRARAAGRGGADRGRVPPADRHRHDLALRGHRGLILWYRLPVESMQKAILIGFVPYLIFFYMVLELQTANLWPRGGWLAGLNTWAWPLLLGYWARSAWQPFREIMPRGRPRARSKVRRARRRPCWSQCRSRFRGSVVVACFALVSSAIVLYLLGHRNERQVRRDWELLLTPKGERLYRSIEGRVHNEMALAAIAYDEAFTVRELGSLDESKQLLDVGYKVIEKFSPNMMKLLAAMASFSRMVSAMAPVTPLRPRDFKLTQISSLAYLNGVLHQFLVSHLRALPPEDVHPGPELRRGLALPAAVDAEDRQRNEPEAQREWEQVKAIRDDFQTLTDESLEGLRQLLTSLAAERKDADLDRFDRSGF